MKNSINSLAFGIFSVLLLVFGIGSCGRGGSAPITSSPGLPGTAATAQPYATPIPSATVAAPSSTPSSNEDQIITVIIPSGSTGKGAAAYGVNPLTIQKGTTVTWVNQDLMPHSATSNSGIWDSLVLNTGQSYSFKFSNPGTFPYYCTVHGTASMSGTIQVIDTTR